MCELFESEEALWLWLDAAELEELVVVRPGAYLAERNFTPGWTTYRDGI